MAKLYFKYGAMNSGKTIDILRTAHNYEEKGYKAIIIKPSVDKKGNKNIVARIGISRSVDYLITPDDLPSELIINENPTIILADEAQFFSKEQIEDLWFLSKKRNIIVFCYGLKSDFKTNGFPGSLRLFELCDKMEEITTLCECGKKATFNLRKVNGEPTFDGDQVAIDGFDEVTYDAVCGDCYIKKFNECKVKGFTKQRKLF